jgi:hypothetical protein
MSHIIIQVEGGIVQDVFLSDTKGTPGSAIIVDFDECEVDETCFKVGKASARIGALAFSPLPKKCDVRTAYEEFLKTQPTL